VTQEKEDEHIMLSDKAIFRRMEMVGFVERDDNWFLYDAISDTNFKGLSYSNEDKWMYLYLAKIDEEKDIQSYIEDLGVVLYRTEKKCNELVQEKNEYTSKIEDLQNEQSTESTSIQNTSRVRRPQSYFQRSMQEYNRQIRGIDEKLSIMTKMFLGFIIKHELDSKDILKKIEEVVGGNKRYEIIISSKDEIVIGDIRICLSGQSH